MRSGSSKPGEGIRFILGETNLINRGVRKQLRKFKRILALAMTTTLIGNTTLLFKNESAFHVLAVPDIAEGEIFTYQSEWELIPELETSAIPVSFFSLSDGNVSLTDYGETWFERLDLSEEGCDIVEKFYDTLVEAVDNDGINDFLIEDQYFDGTAKVSDLFGADNAGTYIIIGTVSGETVSSGEEFKSEMQEIYSRYSPYLFAVTQAFNRDYADVFWISTQEMIGYSAQSDSNGNYEVTFRYLLKNDNFDLRDTNYPDENTIKNAISVRDSKVAEITSAVSGKSTVEKIKYFNKVLTESNEYNTSDDLNSIALDCRRCISALEGRIGTDGPVCEAYARAFKVLCDKVDIPCVLVDGNSATGAHMWNNVEIGNHWYGVDVTWDDPVVEGISGAVSGYENEKYLLVGADTIIEGKGDTFAGLHVVENRVAEGGVAFINGPELHNVAYTETPEEETTTPEEETTTPEEETTTPEEETTTPEEETTTPEEETTTPEEETTTPEEETTTPEEETTTPEEETTTPEEETTTPEEETTTPEEEITTPEEETTTPEEETTTPEEETTTPEEETTMPEEETTTPEEETTTPEEEITTPEEETTTPEEETTTPEEETTTPEEETTTPEEETTAPEEETTTPEEETTAPEEETTTPEEETTTPEEETTTPEEETTTPEEETTEPEEETTTPEEETVQEDADSDYADDDNDDDYATSSSNSPALSTSITKYDTDSLSQTTTTASDGTPVTVIVTQNVLLFAPVDGIIPVSGSPEEIIDYGFKKGFSSTLRGIVTGEGVGYSKWRKDNSGWWLEFADGGYAAANSPETVQWEMVDSSWYCFGNDGYVRENWVFDSATNGWYFVDINAGMQTGWKQIDGKWYYLNPISDGTKGKMLTDIWIGDYYVGKNGEWERDKVRMN